MRDELRRLSEDVTRYYDEVDRQIAHTGMEGLADLLTLSHHLETALGVVGAPALDRTVLELRALLERLIEMDAELRRVRALKLKLVAESDD